MSLPLRQPDLQWPPNLAQFRPVDAAVHQRVAARADADQVPQRRRLRLIVSHAAGRRSGGATADTVELTWRARLPILRPPRVKELGEIAPQDQNWSLVVARRQAPLDPLAHGVPVNAEASGDLFHRVAAVGLDEPVIRVAHGLTT